VTAAITPITSRIGIHRTVHRRERRLTATITPTTASASNAVGSQPSIKDTDPGMFHCPVGARAIARNHATA
jgi:hypothetical protein